jgi:hypothetical protein
MMLLLVSLVPMAGFLNGIFLFVEFL